MLFKNILVPYDGSSHSKHAFKVALDMAKKYNSKLSMVTVLSSIYAGHWGGSSDLQELTFKEARKGISHDFEKFESIAKNTNVSFTHKILEGVSISKSLVIFAKSKKFDLIVMGAHDRTGWDKLILGSVTDSVAHRVRCPVLIVR